MTRALLIALLLAGCTKPDTVLQTVTIKPEPFDAQCRTECRIPCTEPGPLVKAGDDGYAPDSVAQFLSASRHECDARRNACVECIDRIKSAGLTK